MSKKSTFELKGDKVIITPKDPTKPFECEWDIILKDPDRPVIGKLSFEGEKMLGRVPLQIEIFETQNRNRGFGTEAIKMIKEWTLYHKDIYEVTAEVLHENDSAVIAFEKAGFVFRDGTREIEHYSATRQKSSWLGLYAVIGIIIGLLLVILVPSYPFFTFSASMIVCLAAGLGMDARENAHQRKVTGQKEINNRLRFK